MRALDGRGIEFSIGVKQSKTIRALIDQIPESDWVAITDYPESGQLQIAETQLGMWRRIVRRTRLVGAQGELFPDLRHHCFATNRTVPILIADVDHRDHATIELVIRDLTAAYGHSECPARWLATPVHHRPEHAQGATRFHLTSARSQPAPIDLTANPGTQIPAANPDKAAPREHRHPPSPPKPSTATATRGQPSDLTQSNSLHPAERWNEAKTGGPCQSTRIPAMCVMAVRLVTLAPESVQAYGLVGILAREPDQRVL